jgi:hypothetical protein
MLFSAGLEKLHTLTRGAKHSLYTNNIIWIDVTKAGIFFLRDGCTLQWLELHDGSYAMEVIKRTFKDTAF